MSFYRSIQRLTPKYIYLKRSFHDSPFTLLDVGAGNHSASKTKKIFPNAEYHGVDMNKDYANDAADFNAMHSFYEMDLTLLDFKSIPDNYFDFIRIAHVIEHLHNGDLVIKGLLPKLKNGGSIYIEYPGAKSTKLPSMYGTLNFYDDPTHVRIYSVKEIETILKNAGCNIISSGTRRNKIFLLATPFRALAGLFSSKKMQGNIFWDLLGFAEYVVGKKK